ncbi:MAG: hypothetical protein ACUVQP_04370 [Bacteroidales bacterium]
MKKVFFILFFLKACITDAQICNNPVTSNCSDVVAGTSRFYMSTPGNIDFTFSDIQKYISGITYSGSTQLRLTIDEIVPGACKWKLMMYIDNNNHLPANEWEPLVTYGSSGNIPELDLIQVKVYNGCGTPYLSGVYRIFENNNQYDTLNIIPELPVRNLPGSCDGTEVNSPGSYLTDYNEFSFTIDYRIIPGFQHRPGIYQISIHFCLVEVP